MKIIKILALITAAALLLTGCGNAAFSGNESTTETDTQPETAEKADEFSSFDLISEWDNTATVVSLSGSTAAISGSGASAADGNVTISQSGTYLISGTLTDGTIYVNIPEGDKAQLVLNGVTVRSASTAALVVEQADKVVLTLADGTVNNFSDSDVRSEDDAETNACIFSKEDLTVNGTGTLEVNGRYNNGIASKDDLKIVSGSIAVDAVNNAIKGKDSVAIKTCNLTITGADDAIKADNTEDEKKGYVYIENGSFDISCSGDAIDAETDVTILDGSFKLVTGGGSVNGVNNAKNEAAEGFGGFRGEHDMHAERPSDYSGEMPYGKRDDSLSGGETQLSKPNITVENTQTQTDTEAETEADTDVSTKGIKGGTSVSISGGTFEIDSCDDSIHTNGTLTVSGGSFTISSGDDGMHADMSLLISGGTVDILKSYEGIESLSVTVSDGKISVVSADDGINAAGGNDMSSMGGRPGMNGFGAGEGSIAISGGSIVVNADGDGIDSNNTVSMTGGTVVVYGPTNSGNGALDYGSSFTVSGGVLLACGAGGMAQSVSSDSQGVLSFNTQSAANSLLTITDSDGNELISFASEKKYENVVFTSSSVKAGESYKIISGGSNSGTALNGVYSGGSTSGGTDTATVKAQ